MNTNSRKPRQRLTKAEKIALYQNSEFAHIQSYEGLVEFLSNDANNPYNKLVLELMQREKTLTEEQRRSAFDEKHHIIPVRKGGPDEAWNLISVTYEEHCKLHQILFELYGEEGDYKAANARKNAGPETREAKIEASRRGHATMKQRGIGFYDSNLQRELGKRSGGKKTPSRELAFVQQAQRSDKYVKIFEQSLTLHYNKGLANALCLPVAANTFQRTGQIKEFLLENMSVDDPQRVAIQNDKYFTSNFNKVLRGLLGEVGSQDVRLSYKGWSIEVS